MGAYVYLKIFLWLCSRFFYYLSKNLSFVRENVYCVNDGYYFATYVKRCL
jgi:hypothetical protein